MICKNVDVAHPLDNSEGIIYWTHIQDNMNIRHTGGKDLLNCNTYD